MVFIGRNSNCSNVKFRKEEKKNDVSIPTHTSVRTKSNEFMVGIFVARFPTKDRLYDYVFFLRSKINPIVIDYNYIRSLYVYSEIRPES